MPEERTYDRVFAELKEAFNGSGYVFTPFPEGTADRFAEFIHADHDSWIQYFGGKPFKSEDPKEELAFMCDTSRKGNRQFDFFVQHEAGGPYAGYAYVVLPPDSKTAQVGVFALPSYRGKGRALAVTSIVTEGLEKSAGRLGIEEIITKVKTDNLPSLWLMKGTNYVRQQGEFASDYGKKGSFVKFVRTVDAAPARGL